MATLKFRGTRSIWLIPKSKIHTEVAGRFLFSEPHHPWYWQLSLDSKPGKLSPSMEGNTAIPRHMSNYPASMVEENGPWPKKRVSRRMQQHILEDREHWKGQTRSRMSWSRLSSFPSYHDHPNAVFAAKLRERDIWWIKVGPDVPFNIKKLCLITVLPLNERWYL
jgi:hypothetical protein